LNLERGQVEIASVVDFDIAQGLRTDW